MTSAFSSATDLPDALRRKEISSAELTESYIRRIERHDHAVNAVVIRDFDRAREHAAKADAARARGADLPLLGLPMTIKDCLHVEGLPTTAGAPERAGHIADRDSLVVERVRAAGAIFLGKTNVPPYAADNQAWNELFGRTSNPWNGERTSGGSSGGAAAALAAGLTGLEIGSDFAGSIRQPAAFCGVYGHKPSETAVPRTGHVPGGMLPNIAICMEAQGPMARSAADLALALDIVAGPDVGEEVAWRIALPPPRHDRLRDFRVAFLPVPRWLEVDDDIVAASDRLAGELAAAGAKVAVAQPDTFGDMLSYHRVYARMCYAMTGRGTKAERQAKARRLRAKGGEDALAHADGLEATASQYIRWCDARESFRAGYRAFFADWDVLVAPNHSVNAFPHDSRPVGERDLVVNGRTVDATVELVHPGVANLCGQPSTAFPCGLSREGLPVGLQAIGPYLEDHTVIRFAGLVADLGFTYQPPPGFGSGGND
ncbi:amidase [Actinocrispum sp. NPDC049592]|uniref:amidase n=1 Tax=Actinocrispum sp. NPDC049592 TaxID=3154835 RepID=UPI003427CAED